MSVDKHPGVLAIAERLEQAGFKKRAGLIFTRTVDATPDSDGNSGEVLGWVGLNTATQSPAGAALINPVIGVRHQDVERVVADVRGEKFHGYRPPTYSLPLSAITESVGPNDFELVGDDRDGQVVDDLIAAFTAHGEPFIARHADPGQLAEKLQAQFPDNQSARYRYPVLLEKLGRPEDAAAAAREALAAVADRSDMAAREQRPYFEELIRRSAGQVPQRS